MAPLPRSPCVSRYPTDRWSSQNYFCFVCAYTFVFVLVHFTIRFSRYSCVGAALRAHRQCCSAALTPSRFPTDLSLRLRPAVRDSFDIIALPDPFVNTFFTCFLPFLPFAPYPRFSHSPPAFFRLHSLPFQTHVPYIFESILDFSRKISLFQNVKGDTFLATIGT